MAVAWAAAVLANHPGKRKETEKVAARLTSTPPVA
jgi:hypothetical protein